MAIDRPGGPYGAEMTDGGAWPDVDEDAYFRRADELDAKRKQLTGALENWQRHETMLFSGSHVWSGTAANAAANEVGRLTQAMQTHQRQFSAAIKQAHTTGNVLIWAKQQIIANVEHAQAEIAEVERNSTFTQAQKSFFADGNTQLTRSKNLAVIETAVLKLGPAPKPEPNVRLASSRPPVPLAPSPSPTPDPPSYKPEDVADLIHKIDEWKKKRDLLTVKIEEFNKKPSEFNISDPVQFKEAAKWQLEHDALEKERAKISQEWGGLTVDIAQLGGEIDEKTGDIVWPDSTRTHIGR